MKVSKKEHNFDGREGLCDFLEKHCEISGSRDDRVPRQLLLSEYAAFCHTHSHPIASTVSTGRFLARMGVRAGARVGGKKNQQYIYVGIKYDPQDSGTARITPMKKEEDSVQETLQVNKTKISNRNARGRTGRVWIPRTSLVATPFPKETPMAPDSSGPMSWALASPVTAPLPQISPVAIPQPSSVPVATPSPLASPATAPQPSASLVTILWPPSSPVANPQPPTSPEAMPQPSASQLPAFPVDAHLPPAAPVDEPFEPFPLTTSVSVPSATLLSTPLPQGRSKKGFKGRKELSIYLSENYEVTGKADHKITRPQLYTHYRQFCTDHCCHVASIVNVGRFLAKMGVRASTRVGGKDGQVYAYVGIRPVPLTKPCPVSSLPQPEFDVNQIKREVEEVVVEVDMDCIMYDESF